jgi:uncharacterized protein YegJ (DUF2314 family)
MGYLASLFIKCLAAGTFAFFIALTGHWIYRRYFCDQVVSLDHEDHVVQDAINIARKGLPQFWRAFDRPSPGQEQFMVKVRIPCGGGAEHVWCHVAKRNGNLVNGIVANRPLDASYKFGDEITFCDEDISDWLYFYLGRPVGGETGRVIESTVGLTRS